MLVECPRCHFRQPQDQYCASCGVDMLAFKPKAEPIITQIAKSGLFQFIMVIILGVGVTWFVIRTDRPQQWIQRINRFASVSTNNPSAKATQSTEAGIAEDEAEFEAPPAAASAWASRSMVASSPEATAVAIALPSTQTTDGASMSQSVTTALRMHEIDNEYLNTILQQAHNNNSVLQDSEVKIFILPQTSTMTSVQNLNSANMKVVLNEVSRANYGTNNRGFNLSMSLISSTAETNALRLQLNKIHPNDSLQIPLDFNLRKGEKLVIAGNPLLSYFEFETDLAERPPFQIFKSADYRNQKTTFAIVIELQ